MSAKTKTRAQKVGKFLGITLFALLMFFNIKFAISDDSNGDIDLMGLKISIFSTNSYAYGIDGDRHPCYDDVNSSCTSGGETYLNTRHA
jgi:hypothetical protein